jgi:hypothetical protein
MKEESRENNENRGGESHLALELFHSASELLIDSLALA